jgi:proteic killer suppression protein
MIKNFRHKGLRAYFLTGNASGINSQHKQRIKDQLEFLHSADCVDDMDLPGYDLHELKGSRTQEWAIKVSKNWRIVFKFEEGDAYIVNYEDYH